MKRALALTCSFLFVLVGCVRDPGPSQTGGQSRDGSDLSPGKGAPPVLCGREDSPFALDVATPFGASALELVSNVAPANESPLFWVPFDGIPGATFTPGPGETSITLAIEPRTGELATLASYLPRLDGALCEDDKLHVPVHVTLRSADGALDTSIDAELLFTSATTAELLTGFALDALDGSFAFGSLGEPELGYVATGLVLEAQLWPGGSRGQLVPSLDVRRPVPPPNPSGYLEGVVGPAIPSPPAPPTTGVIQAPAISEHWQALAVWPRLDTCTGDCRGEAYAYEHSDRVIGSSLTDIVEAINALGPFTVALGDQTASLLFQAETPTNLRCAAPKPFGTEVASRSLSFDVQATLRAEDAAGSALAQLDTPSIFEITATSAADGMLAELRWSRRDRAVGQSRSAFEQATGLTFDAPAEYDQLFWSWDVSATRADAMAPWSPRGALVVTSLNSEQTAESASVQTQGGPCAGFFGEETKFPGLPGRPLIDAEILP
jgi:hypothetical protein